jgi:DNA-binding ferritin-like protein
MKKHAFGEGGLGDQLTAVAPTIGGLITGFPTGRALAGETAAGVAPHGRMGRSHEIARQIAIATAPIGGIAGLILAKKYHIGDELADLLARKFPQGLVANPDAEREIAHIITPFLAGIGGSAAGGIATGALTGGVARMLPDKPGMHKKEASDLMSDSARHKRIAAAIAGGAAGGTAGGLLGSLAGRHVPGRLGESLMPAGLLLGGGVGSLLAEHGTLMHQLKNKESMMKLAMAYKEAFEALSSYLRALYQLLQWMHWRSKGSPFYGDHLLFQRLYEETSKEMDSIAEKSIGLTNDINVVAPAQNSADAAQLLKGFDVTVEGALRAEHGFIELIKRIHDGLGELLTDGLDNLLQGIADTHEGHVYLLQQRLSQGQEKKSGVLSGHPVAKWIGEHPRITLGGLGAVGGASMGYNTTPEGHKGTGALIGGALGGGGGALLGSSFKRAIDTAKATAKASRDAELDPYLAAKFRGMQHKTAEVLDLALGYFYTKEGPGHTKHAAAGFYSYRINPQERDRDTLGDTFCKVAEALNQKPWDLATLVVRYYSAFEKTAGTDRLSHYYCEWANQMIKKAMVAEPSIFTPAQRVAKAVAKPFQRAAQVAGEFAGTRENSTIFTPAQRVAQGVGRAFRRVVPKAETVAEKTVATAPVEAKASPYHKALLLTGVGAAGAAIGNKAISQPQAPVNYPQSQP